MKSIVEVIQNLLKPYIDNADAAITNSLAAVATSGSYNDLTDKPSIPAAQVNADWNAASGVAQILNKPDLSEKADVVANATNGNFAGLDANGNLTDSGKAASDFLSSSYLESSTKTTADAKDTFTFTNAAITANASFDVYSDVFGAPIVDMVLSGTQLSVSFNSSDNVTTCRLYIK